MDIPSILIIGLILSALIAIFWMMFHGRQFLAESVIKDLEESGKRQRDAFEQMDNAAKWKVAMVRGVAPTLAVFIGSGIRRWSTEIPSWFEAGKFLLAVLVGYGACVLLFRAFLGQAGKTKGRLPSES